MYMYMHMWYKYKAGMYELFGNVKIFFKAMWIASIGNN